MPRFLMTVTETYTNVFEVEATDDDAATESAEEMATERRLPSHSVEVCNRTIAVSEAT